MGTISAELVTGDERRDARGRRLAGQARREAVLAGYDGCGTTQREFARMEGVNYNTLVKWLCERRKAAGGRATPKIRFAQVRMSPGAGVGLEVCLPGGMIVRGHDAGQVAMLVKALG